MVWDGIRWYEMVWDGMRWYEMVWNGMGWYEKKITLIFNFNGTLLSDIFLIQGKLNELRLFCWDLFTHFAQPKRLAVHCSVTVTCSHHIAWSEGHGKIQKLFSYMILPTEAQPCDLVLHEVSHENDGNGLARWVLLVSKMFEKKPP